MTPTRTEASIQPPRESLPTSSLWRRQITFPRVDRGVGLCALALAALLLVLFPRVFFLGEVFFERDVFILFVPQAEAFVRSIHAFSWPVWDPGVGFGTPMLGNANTQVFYPFTWLNLLVRPLTLYVLYVLAHLMFTGLGFHLWARRVGLSSAAATLGACVWVGSGPLLSFVNIWNHLAGASWLPWALWAFDRAMSARPRGTVGLAFVLAMQIYAGSPDLCVFTGLVLGADALRRIGLRPPRWRPLLVIVGAYALAIGLGAAQIAPSLDLALHSERRDLSVEARTSGSLHPAALVQTLLPISFKEVPRLAPQTVQSLSELWMPFVASTYLGLAAALLVVYAFAGGERRIPLFFAFLLVASLAVALGRHSVVYAWLSAVTPPMQMLRHPSKIAIVAALSWAMLTGLGFDAWRRGRVRWPVRLSLALRTSEVTLAATLVASAAGFVFFPGTLHLPAEGPPWATLVALSGARVSLAAVAAAAVSLIIHGKPPATWTKRLVPLIVVAELALANRAINPVTRPERFDRPPEILEFIPRNPPARVYVWDYVLRAPGRGHPTAGILGLFAELDYQPDRAAQNLAMQAYLYPPSAARWGLRGSFDRDLLGLAPPWLNEMNLLLRAVEDTPAYTQLLQIGGVNRVVALHRDHPSLPLRTEITGVFRRPIAVFDVPAPWPRTYVVCRARTVSNDRALRTLLAADFDPNQEVTVDQALSLPGTCRSGESRIVDDRPDRVTLDVVLDGPGVVVLLDGAANGWEVFVDDAPEQVLRVNHIFRGVKVDAGRHRATFLYRPAGVRLGLSLTAATVLAIVIVLAAAWASRRE